MKTDKLTKERAVQIILNAFHDVEAIWDDANTRKKQLREIRSLLSQMNSEKNLNIPFLTRLHKHIDENISLEQLWTLMVPVEREHSKTNIVDEDFLITTTDDSTTEPSYMPVSVVLDNIRSSFNIGGIFRTADCAGLKKVYLCGYSATPDQPKVQKSSMGTHNSMQWEKQQNILNLIKQMKKDSVQVIALETVSSATAPENANIQFPCAILVGNERFGLDSNILAEADLIVKIPVYGNKNSMNVVSAFSICAYEIRKKWERTRQNK